MVPGRHSRPPTPNPSAKISKSLDRGNNTNDDYRATDTSKSFTPVTRWNIDDGMIIDTVPPCVSR
ncbi:uncharacterized protein BO72DRAFT_445941 [Aspergillus fijiensis CBS 313.89]|uniref:Uncharacterized protein n=1 Tax=Aspergillus fijiensis CBS 313.89 TaxID=1448319 RepID=A0A8G1RZG9_9EURO|nr:uncharacterized protein BO72DRAFT_445941 [Aspergillus fijiensis CBS 313.89]RAK79626.1 hypothetical protein BO72DRAFT_445941 [Aspergillus fijiensis CBS 313.89]